MLQGAYIEWCGAEISKERNLGGLSHRERWLYYSAKSNDSDVEAIVPRSHGTPRSRSQCPVSHCTPPPPRVEPRIYQSMSAGTDPTRRGRCGRTEAVKKCVEKNDSDQKAHAFHAFHAAVRAGVPGF